MASEDNKLLQRALAPVFKAEGFRKDGPTWRKASQDTVVVFNIQGSQWGRQFYLNLGVYFRALGGNECPGENHCHVRVRATGLVPAPSRLSDLLDFDRPIEVSARLGELVALVTGDLLPWLRAMSTPTGARDYLHAHPSPAMFIAGDARMLLGVSSGA